MKILVDAHVFDHSYQGTSTYILGLYNAMVKIPGVEVTLCANNIENLKKHFRDPRFQFVKLNSTSKWKRLISEIPKITKNKTYDFAHFQYITPVFKHTKFITTTHDILFMDFPMYFPFSYRFIKGTLFKWSAKRSDIVLTVSQYSKQAIKKHYGINENKIHITPNAVTINNTERNELKNKLPQKYILYVSRFEPRKNHVGLLEVILELNLFEKGYELVLVGARRESIEKTTYSKVVERIPNKHREQVHFIENISAEELSEVYKNAECFVYPSLAEGFGIPPLEAAVAGCKVVCSNTTAMNDFSFFKYHFDPNNKELFKKEVFMALEDRDYPFENITSKVKELYNWDTIAKNFFDHISKK